MRGLSRRFALADKLNAGSQSEGLQHLYNVTSITDAVNCDWSVHQRVREVSLEVLHNFLLRVGTGRTASLRNHRRPDKCL